MRSLLILVMLGLTGCGRGDHDGRLTTNAEFLDYMLRFEQEVGADTSDISVAFANQKEGLLGTCYAWSDGRRNIEIDPKKWAALDTIGKEQLIYHELGHCALNLDHNNAQVIDPDGYTIHGSIMNQYYFGSSWNYKKYRTGYKGALKAGSLLTDFTAQ